MVRKIFAFAFALAVAVTLIVIQAGWAEEAENAAKVRYVDGVAYEHIGDYSVERLNKIMTTEVAEFSSFPITYPPAQNAVSLYRVVYPTVIPELGNRPTQASGLIAIPNVTAKTLPVVSYQHGTVFTKTAVPSFPEESMETRLLIARFAGQGYIVIGADYVGKGISSDPDSYMVKECTAQACYDMLIASRSVCTDMKLQQGELFLSGWSQGAFSTMAFRYKLECLGVPIKAAATASTPNDMYMLLTRWINHPTSLDANWLVGSPSLFIHSYEYYYGMQGLSQAVIKPEYWQMTKDFYSNKSTWEQAAKVLPVKVKDLVQPDVVTASSLAADRFFKKLQENQVYQWRYQTPSRYYYGKVDEVIPPYVATLPVEFQNIVGGAPAESVYAGDKADHRGTFLFGVLDQKEWFDRLMR